MNKAMHGQFTRQTKNFASKKFAMAQRGCLKSQTESLLITVQIKLMELTTERQESNAVENQLCWMFKEKDETVTDLVSECINLAQKEYKRRHDKYATIRITKYYRYYRVFQFN